MSNPNELERQAERAAPDTDRLALDKETVKDLEAQTDASEAVKGGLPPTAVLCLSHGCGVTQLCFTPNPS